MSLTIEKRINISYSTFMRNFMVNRRLVNLD